MSRYHAAFWARVGMKRREFLGLLGGAAVACPVTARAQPSAIPVVGFLSTAESVGYAHLVAGFREGLNETGFAEGRNVAIEFRWAEGQFDRLPSLAADLIRRRVAVIAPFSDASVQAAKSATATIPIVFYAGADPVAQGFVTSLNRPGGNATGVSFFATALGGKRLGLLRELLPKAKTMTIIVNPSNPASAAQVKDLQDAARTFGMTVHALNAGNESEIDRAFASPVLQSSDALIIGADAVLNSRHKQFVALTKHHKVPAMSVQREFPLAGGLMSYGASAKASAHQVGIYVGRVLKGEKPADLPVMQSAKFELVINLSTAKDLGLVVPPTLLALADETIE
jgi:putative ABC transport system substrate-binding protein